MAGFVTNRGKYREVRAFYQGQGVPGGFYLALVLAAAVPTVDTNVWSDLSANEIATGNGYSGMVAVARNATDWDVVIEDDTLNVAYVQMKDIVWTAAGGPIPATGAGARYAVLLDDNATPANRDVLVVFDLGADRTISAGQTLTLVNCERRDT